MNRKGPVSEYFREQRKPSPSYTVKTGYRAEQFLLKVQDVLSALLCAFATILILPFGVVKPLVNVFLGEKNIVVFLLAVGSLPSAITTSSINSQANRSLMNLHF